MIDKDRFRTKSGCLTCRRRKKKCDEQRPACADCSRMGLECQWPTEQDNAKDRRLRKIGKLPVRAPASQSPPPARVKDSASSTSSTLAVQRKEDVLSFALNSVMNRTIWDDETILLAFHVNTMLPTLVHRDAHRRYQDTTFTSSLLKNEKPLRDAALACVSMTLSRKLSSDKYWKSKMRKQALSYKNSAIIGIRERIAMGDVDGSEDWLFIAANQLTLFDDLDNNALTFSTHVRAAMDLLRCRHYSPKQKLLAQTAAGTDALDKELPAGRICYEGFLYVGITMMLFDREFDISDSAVEWEMIGEYFRTSPLPSEPGAEAWPILGFPFELFRLLVIMVILSRKSLMSDADIDLLGIISKDISKWYDTIHPTGKSSIGYPWLVAGNALLQYLLSQREEGTEFLDDAHKPENEVPPMLSKLEISIHFRPYNLWPLAVLHCISEDDHQREVLKALITKSLENIDGDIHKPAPEQIVNMFMIAPGILSYHPSRDNVPEKGSPPMKLVELRDEDD